MRWTRKYLLLLMLLGLCAGAIWYYDSREQVTQENAVLAWNRCNEK